MASSSEAIMMAGRFSNPAVRKHTITLLDWGEDPNDIIFVLQNSSNPARDLGYAVAHGGLSSLFEDD